MKRIIYLIIFLVLVMLANADVDCKGQYEVCAADCNDECDLLKWEYCREHDYSGCALDVFCYCNVCNIYDQKWCQEYNDFRACAEGVKGSYIGCIKSCQSKREAGQDVSTCWKDCNAELDTKIIECKQDPCHDFCTGEGFETGEWAKYTNEYGWDSCYCTGEKKYEPEKNLPEIPKELLPEKGEDPDKDGWQGKSDECPNEYGLVRGCPDKDRDGIPDRDDACPDEYGPAEYQGCEPGMMVRMKDSFVWLFTKQSIKKQGESGRIYALKNKKGIQVFRHKSQKWMPVGLHTPLYPGDMLKTGPDSKAKLEMWLPNAERNLIELLPNTIYETGYISPDQQYSGQRPISVITKGFAKMIYDKLTGNYKPIYHKTPTVCVGVRGTEFILGHDPDTQEDIIMLFEGELEVIDKDDNVHSLSKGEQVAIVSGTFGDVVPIDEAKWKDLSDEDIRWDEEYRKTNFLLPILLLAAVAGIYIKLKFKKKIKRHKKKLVG